MEIFEAVKQIYQNSQDIVVLLDKDLKMLWCSRTDPPVKFNCMRLSGYVPKQDFTETTVTQYTLTNGDRKSIKLEPLRQDGKVIGYVGTFFDKIDIQLLAEKCDYKDLILSMRSEMMRELALCVGMTEVALGSNEYDARKVKALHDYILHHIKRSYGITVNYEELTSYLANEHDTRTIVNISDLLNDMCRIYKPILAKNNCRLKCTAEPDIYVVTRRRNFLIALTNLITNGIRHNESRTKLIDISLGFSKERQVQLCVRDNGIGLDSEIYKKAIVPFGLHDSKFDHERLGLAVVNMFAKSVGGRLTHRMLRDGGTLMTLYMNEASSADFLLTRERRKYILDKNDYAYHLLTRVIDFD